MSIFKTSKYFIMSLGYSSSMKTRSGDLTLNEKDKFAYFYNKQYKTTIIAQGLIGDISFYLDYYITDDSIAFYIDENEFIFQLDIDIINKKGVDFYIGHLIKNSNKMLEDRTGTKIKVEEERVEDKIIKNPGAMTYEELQKYIQNKKNSTN